MFMETAVEAIAPVDFINQSNAAVASYNSAVPIDMSKFKQALYVISIGVMNTSATLDARVQSCQFSSFNTAVHNMTGTNITQVLNAAANTNIKKLITLRSDQVTQQNAADKYVRLNTTVGTSQVNYEVIGYGIEPVQKPGKQNVNTTIVTESVTCNT